MAALGMCGCNSSREASDAGQAAATPQAVEVAAVQVRSWPKTVRAQGSMIGDEHAVIGVKVAGRVREVMVDLGSVVSAGDVLARLEAEDFDLRVQQAEAQINQARAALGLKPGDDDERLDRTKVPLVLQERALLDEARLNDERARQLIEKNVITTAELQATEAALRVAEARFESALNSVEEQLATLAVRKAELAVARQSQSDAVIRAPFSGVVQQRHVGPGVYLNVGQPVAALVRTDPLRFRAGVPERQSARLAVGQAVRLSVEGMEQPIEARISRISPALDLSNRSLTIEADVANPNFALRSGLFAEAEIVIDAGQRALAVPAPAVVEFAGVEKVWLVRKGQAGEQRVRTGRRNGQWIEILDGLQEGDQVVARGEQGRAGQVTVLIEPGGTIEAGDSGLVRGKEDPPSVKGLPAVGG
ncbi:MAG: efflux RND transporter periplasmic adaptor subunit [Pirellulales bacterium]